LQRVFKPVIAVLLVIIAAALLLGARMLAMPGQKFKETPPPLTAAEQEIKGKLERYVNYLAGTLGERNLHRQYANLIEAAAYIRGRFESYGYPVKSQPLTITDRTTENLEATHPGQDTPEKIVLIGAHYDSVAGSPGANDNATGVAALLVLAEVVQALPTEKTVRLVAFTNEEPPYFQTPYMGSVHYAKAARQAGDRIVAMLSLETMGYYSDEPGSQGYPPPLDLFYPDTGNFIGFIGNLRSRSLVTKSIKLFRRNAPFPSEGAALPGHLPGVGWSDHWSFWRQGYPGIMLTDTAPFRYPYYHTLEDTPDKIDYARLARVVMGILHVVKELAGG
jgi:Zn-dependent M28 family amino/carboxypeptidase